MPEITEGMMSIGGLTADYKDIANRTMKIAKILEKGKNVEITTPSGAKLTMNIEGRTPERDTGLSQAWRLGKSTSGRSVLGSGRGNYSKHVSHR